MRTFLLDVVIIGSLLAGIARGEIPRKDPSPGDTLQAVLDRIHNHAAGEAWKEPGWKDDAIEAWLDKLVGSVAKAAEIADLKLPVRLAEVKAGDPMPARLVRNQLIVGRDINLRGLSVHDSIILADGSVEVESVRGSVIVARAAITVSGLSAYSVFVGGAYVRVAQFDGEPNKTYNGSLIASRGWADIETAYGTIVAASKGATIRRIHSATFINAPVPDQIRPIAPNAAPRSVKVPELQLESLPLHPLAAEIDIVGVVCTEPAPVGRVSILRKNLVPVGLVFRHSGRRIIADLAQPIVDDVGNPIEALRDWKLTYVNENLAIFSSGPTDAVVRIEK